MNVISMGSKDYPDHGIGWEKRDDMDAHVLYIGPLNLKNAEFGPIDAKTHFSEVETMIFFHNKNGKKSLKAMIAALRAMLAEWEYEDDKNEPETQTGH